MIPYIRICIRICIHMIGSKTIIGWNLIGKWIEINVSKRLVTNYKIQVQFLIVNVDVVAVVADIVVPWKIHGHGGTVPLASVHFNQRRFLLSPVTFDN
jgi:uncharacterized membrane protein